MSLTINIDADDDWDSSSARLSELADPTLRAAIAESAYPGLADTAREVEVSLALLSDADVHDLNRQWREKDRPTNVLSFPMIEPGELDEADRPGPPLMLGDMALAHGVCAREANEKKISLEDHARHLMVHGMLHLLGYDHLNDEEATDMEARETRALARLGIADPYGDHDGHQA
ncbi:rRNA maturation RNase YbeY [Sphingomicrobium astaxanthinifaciens]|uniref:rRNA maturation RNase YbeY n=1 Tax=Sphingomicrobium astaxanthinifaciens TaxID=1227949 RepID=UPI001FCCB615|nr:rRNA maturation RNase YbeY [Sphingomicrobium astaxanthinifaciens]MCJ7420694.1 rRNA maturation RNase YbeY [Sphingomicrobium astaxanthinifaciens]